MPLYYEPSMCRYPMGVSPLISHHNPAVIPTLWREGICHLAACFPLLSQEQSWALIYCEVSPRLAQSPCLPNYWMEETAHHEHDLFLEDCYPGQCGDWLRSRLFLPCHPQLHIQGKRAVGFWKDDGKWLWKYNRKHPITSMVLVLSNFSNAPFIITFIC